MSFSGMTDFFDLSGPGMHRLGNILTLDVNNHEAFNSMIVWFEEDPVRPHLQSILE